MSASVAMTIRKLESGEYLAKVNKETKVCHSFLEAAAWAEKQMEGLQEPSPALPSNQ